MRLLILLLVPILLIAKSYPSCNVKLMHNFPHLNGNISFNIKGVPCYEATYEIKINSKGKTLYTYKERFKPHIAVHWEEVSKLDAEIFLKDELDEWRFSNCSELPAIEQNGDLPYYEDLLISKKEYLNYKKSNCIFYIHTYKHYEGNRIIIFPKGKNEVIIAR